MSVFTLPPQPLSTGSTSYTADPTTSLPNIFDLMFELEQMISEIAKEDREFNRQMVIQQEKQERKAKDKEIETYSSYLSIGFNLFSTAIYAASGVMGFAGDTWKKAAEDCVNFAKGVDAAKSIEGNWTQYDREAAKAVYTTANELKRAIDEERRHAVGEYDKSLERALRILEKLSQIASELMRG